MSVAEAARHSGYTAQHLNLLARTGKIPAIRQGTSWLISLSDLTAYEQKAKEDAEKKRLALAEERKLEYQKNQTAGLVAAGAIAAAVPAAIVSAGGAENEIAEAVAHIEEAPAVAVAAASMLPFAWSIPSFITASVAKALLLLIVIAGGSALFVREASAPSPEKPSLVAQGTPPSSNVVVVNGTNGMNGADGTTTQVSIMRTIVEHVIAPFDEAFLESRLLAWRNAIMEDVVERDRRIGRNGGGGSSSFNGSSIDLDSANIDTLIAGNATTTSLYTSTLGIGADYLTDITGYGLAVVNGELTVTLAASPFATSTADAWLTTKTTDDLAEGTTNLYYLDSRARNALSAGTGLTYATTTGVFALDTSGNWGGTFDGFEGSYYLANSFSTSSAASWLNGYDKSYFFSTSSALAFEATQGPRIADDLTDNSIEDLLDVATMVKSVGDLLSWNGSAWVNVATSSLGFTGSGGPAVWGSITGTLANQTDLQNALTAKFSLADWYATTTDALDEGLGNLYFTNVRADARIASGTSTIRNMFSAGSGLTYSGGQFALNATGDWTGTFDGQEGSYYLNRANHTGTQLASTISDFAATARGLFSSTATGLTYTSGTGVFSLSSGYTIPLSASTTNWNNFYNTPSTRITAGTGLLWTGNTLSVSTSSLANLNADTLDGFDSSYFLANSFSTTSANAWFATKTTDNLAQGSTNLYFSNALARSALSGGAGINYSTTTGVITLNATGDWTGTFDGQEGSYYLARANHTGTQLASTISDFAAAADARIAAGSTTIRNMFSTTATGLTYNSSTGATSLTAGYEIPLSASTSQWQTAYGWGNHATQGYLTAISTTTVRGMFSATSPITYNSGTGAFGFNFGTNNTWTGTNSFSAAGTTITGVTDGCVQFLNGQFTSTGTACGTGSGSGGLTNLNGLTTGGQAFATTSDTNIGIRIVSSGSTHTFSPTWTGTLAASRGGTGIGSVTDGQLLIGAPGNTWTQVATSSLGLPSFADLSGYLSLAAWYATTTDALTEGTIHKYWTLGRFAAALAGTTTDALAQGSTNLYFSNALARSALSGGAGINYSTTTGVITLNATGDWTGTFDGQEGSYYLARANHTGTQLASTISDFAAAADARIAAASSTIRTMFSTSATGLTYTSGTGILGLTAGYTIPLSASTTEWSSFYTTPSTRITAGTGLLWTGNTLSVSTSSLANLNATTLNGQTGSYYLARANHTGTQTASTISDFSTAADARIASGTSTIRNMFSAGSGLTYSGGQFALNATGDWTGTFDGQEGSYYLNRANHTGTQLASTISDFTSAARAAISETIAGIDYSSGVFALSAGYTIPLSASTTEWATAYGWGNHATQGYLTAISTTTVRGMFSATAPIAYNSSTGNFTLSTTTFSGSGSGLNADLLDGFDSSYFLANSFSTTSANSWLATKTTDNLAQGSTNLYFSNALARNALSAGGGITYSTSTGVISLNATGDWTGTFDGQEGSYYLNRANHTGTQLASTISDFASAADARIAAASSTIRNMFSATATGLTYSSGTGILGLTAGYTIPLAASTTNWTSFYNTPSTRITAGTGLLWTGNTLSVSTSSLANLNATTLNGQPGSYYLSRANHTGTQTASTISDFSAAADARIAAGTSTIRGMFSASSPLAYNSSTGNFTLSTAGDWTGTFDGQEGSYYLARANHTGTQLANTISDFASAARGLFSSTATGLTYTSGTGVFSLSGGYTIPLAASTTNWETAYLNRITSLTTTGTSGAATLSANVLNIPQYQAQGNYITALTGDGTASGPGSAAFTLATVNSNVGTFNNVTVNGKGLVTAASNVAYLTGNQAVTLSGDVSGSGTTTITTTLATVNSTTGSFGSSTAIPNFTVNAKGLITAAGTSAVIAPAGTLTGTTLASNVVTSSLTSVGTLTGLTVSGNTTLANATSTNVYTSTLGLNSESFTDLTGTGLSNVGGALTLNATGDWTGTFDGQEGSYYLDRANHTGTQLANTISDFASAARGLFSSTATGVTYTNGTGVFSLTSGYEIPLSASTSNWTSFYNTPSTRITAGTGLGWTGNTLSVSTSSLGLSAGYFAQGGNSFGTSAILGTNDSNALAFKTNNATRLTILTNGNIGIGTTTPISLLSLASTTPAITLTNTAAFGGIGKSWQMRVGATGGSGTSFDIYDVEANNSMLSILRNTSSNSNDSQVLIGTTTNFTGNNSRLFVFGGNNGANIDTMGDKTINGGLGDVTNIEAEGSNWGVGGNTNSIALRYYGVAFPAGIVSILGDTSSNRGILDFGTASTSIIRTLSSTPIRFGIQDTEIMRLTSTGLGIGTTTPGEKLSVGGNAYIGGNLTATGTAAVSGLATFGSGINVNGETFTDLTGTGLTNSGGALSVSVTGDWTGTFDGQEGSYYLDRANHTGTQLASTISDFTSVAQASISESITGIDYTSGAFSMTPGYGIPRTASTTSWNSFYNDPSTRINAGSGLTWNSNVLSVSTTSNALGLDATYFAQGGNSFGTSAILGTNDSNTLAFETNNATRLTIDTSGNVGIGTTTPYAKLSVNGDLALTGGLYDNNATRGMAGMVLQSTGTGAQWVATSTLGISSGSGTINSGTAGQFPYYAASGTTLTPTSNLFLTTDGRLGIGTTSPDSGLEFSGLSTGTTLTTLSTSTTVLISNRASGLNTYASLAFRTQNASGLATTTAQISAIKTSTTAGAHSGALAFLTLTAGVPSEKMRITSAGLVGIGAGTSPSAFLHVVGSQPAVTSGSSASAATDAMNITGGVGGDTTSNGSFVMAGAGSSISLTAGGGGSILGSPSGTGLAGAGGNVTITAGAGGAAAGASPIHGMGGNVTITAGAAPFSFSGPKGAGGNLTLVAGSSPGGNGDGGMTYIYGGRATGTGIAGHLILGMTSSGTAIGFVGVGTTTPSQLLTVAGNLRLTGAIYDSTNSPGTAGMVLQTTGTGTQWVATSTLGIGGGGGGSLTGSGAANQVAYWSGSSALTGSNSFVFDGTNLGIGTTTPRKRLEIWDTGEVARFGQDSNAGTYLGFGYSHIAGQLHGFLGYDATAGSFMRIQGANGVQLGSGNTWGSGTVMTISNLLSGSVGIGTSVPTARLAIVGTAGTDDLFAIASSTSARLFTVTAAGTVGIGTTSPASLLHVAGAYSSGVDSTIQRLDYGATVNRTMRFGVSTDGTTYIQSSQSLNEAAYRDIAINPFGGNVGIGTTSPSGKLAVTTGSGGDVGLYVTNAAGSSGSNTYGGYFNNTAISLGYAAGVYAYSAGGNGAWVNYGVYGESDADGTGVYGKAITGVSGMGLAGGIGVYGSTASNGTGVYAQGNGTGYALYANGAKSYFGGNVGIGTTTPGAKLTVAGSNQDLLRLEDNNQDRGLIIRNSGGGMQIQAYEPSTGLLTRSLHLNPSGGNVGIGTTNPTTLLTVRGASDLNGGNIAVQGTGAGGGLSIYEDTTIRGILAYGDSGTVLTGADTNSLSLRAEGKLHLAGNGNQLALTVTNGNVGIGTTSPAQKLDVNGNMAVRGDLLIYGGNATLGGTVTANGPGGGLYFAAAGTNQNIRLIPSGTGFVQIPGASQFIMGGGNIVMNGGLLSGDGDNEGVFVANNGNVGIGTTSPSAKLHVFSSSAGTQQLGNFQNSGTGGWYMAFMGNGATRGYLGVDSSIGGGAVFTNATPDSVGLRSEGDLFLGNGLTADLTINSLGYVGIGMTAPNRMLTVNGAIGINSSPGNDGYWLANASGVGRWIVRTRDSEGGSNTGSNFAISARDDSGNFLSDSYFNIQRSTGNVGLGTTNPTNTAGFQKQIQIEGNLPGLTLNNTGAGARKYTVGVNGDFLIWDNNASAARLTVNSSGALSVANLVSCGGIQTNAGGTMSCTSDARLKDVQSPFTSGLDAIMQITPQTYSWKQNSGLYDNGVLYSGFIAQNVGAAIPEAMNEGANGYKQINTTTLLAASINAIKELGGRTAALSLATSSLASRLSVLETPAQESLDVTYATLSVTGLSTFGGAMTTKDISASSVSVPATSFVMGTTTVELPSETLTGGRADLYKMASYAIGRMQGLSTRTDLIIARLDSIEARMAAMEAAEHGGVLSMESLNAVLGQWGVSITNTIARFKTLSAERLFAAADENGEAFAGSGTVLAGNTVVKIENARMTATSKVIVTMTSAVEGSWYVSEKLDGSFRLHLSQSESQDVTFDYFIVDTDAKTPTSTTTVTPPAPLPVPTPTPDPTPAAGDPASEPTPTPEPTPEPTPIAEPPVVTPDPTPTPTPEPAPTPDPAPAP